MKRILFLLFIGTVAATSVAGQVTTHRVPRTESGQPDLEGVWNFNSGVPLQRPPAFADKKFFTKDEFEARRVGIRNALAMIEAVVPIEAAGLRWLDNPLYVEDLRTSLITYPENGRLPALVAGVRREPGIDDLLGILASAKGGPPPALAAIAARLGEGKRDSHTDFSLSERCLAGADVPLVPQLDGNYVQIVQGSHHVALVTDRDRRIVTLAEGPSPIEAPGSWSGTSRGHWEGETLVVETRDFNGRTPSFASAGNSREKVVTERFTRVSPGAIEYAATVVDPKTFQDRIDLRFPMARVDAWIYEGACHEGNYSLRNVLSAARKADEAAQASESK